MITNFVFGGLGFLLGTLMGFLLAGLSASGRINLDEKGV